jgi:hypothetical protein
MSRWVLITALQICPGIGDGDLGEFSAWREACPSITQRQCEGALVDNGDDVFEVTSCFIAGDIILVDFDSY